MTSPNRKLTISPTTNVVLSIDWTLPSRRAWKWVVLDSILCRSELIELWGQQWHCQTLVLHKNLLVNINIRKRTDRGVDQKQKQDEKEIDVIHQNDCYNGRSFHRPFVEWLSALPRQRIPHEWKKMKDRILWEMNKGSKVVLFVSRSSLGPNLSNRSFLLFWQETTNFCFLCAQPFSWWFGSS